MLRLVSALGIYCGWAAVRWHLLSPKSLLEQCWARLMCGSLHAVASASAPYSATTTTSTFCFTISAITPTISLTIGTTASTICPAINPSAPPPHHQLPHLPCHLLRQHRCLPPATANIIAPSTTVTGGSRSLCRCPTLWARTGGQYGVGGAELSCAQGLREPEAAVHLRSGKRTLAPP